MSDYIAIVNDKTTKLNLNETKINIEGVYEGPYKDIDLYVVSYSDNWVRLRHESSYCDIRFDMNSTSEFNRFMKEYTTLQTHRVVESIQIGDFFYTGDTVLNESGKRIPEGNGTLTRKDKSVVFMGEFTEGEIDVAGTYFLNKIHLKCDTIDEGKALKGAKVTIYDKKNKVLINDECSFDELDLTDECVYKYIKEHYDLFQFKTDAEKIEYLLGEVNKLRLEVDELKKPKSFFGR